MNISLTKVMGAWLLGLLAFTLGGFAGETEADSVQSKLERAMERHDWKSALALAEQQGGLHPEDKYWPAVIHLATVRLALERAPRIRQTAALLPPKSASQLKALTQQVGHWVAQSSSQPAESTSRLLAEVKQFALQNPDLPSAWILQAQMALLSARRLEGGIAARNLELLQAWQAEEGNVLALLSQLQVLDWMPAIKANELQVRELKGFSKRIQELTLRSAPTLEFQAVMPEIKLFCRENAELPNGWLLQYWLGAKLGRSLDQATAKKYLAKSTITATQKPQ